MNITGMQFLKNGLIRIAIGLTFLLANHCLSATIFADHLPDNLVAKGKSEKHIAGIALDRFKLKDIIKLYGKPTKSNGNEYIWHKSGVVLRVSISASDMVENGKLIKVSESIGFIEIAGNRVANQIGKTGAGLMLGDSITELQRIYGKKYQARRIANRQISEIHIEWKDTQSLTVYFDARGKINKLSLFAGE